MDILKRPININPFTIRLPLAALVSISHRLSGLCLFLALPWALKILERSLRSEQSFNSLSLYFHSYFIKIFIVLAMMALLFHILAGLRHLLMDLSIGDSYKGGRLGSIIVFSLFFILTAFGMFYWWAV